MSSDKRLVESDPGSTFQEAFSKSQCIVAFRGGPVYGLIVKLTAVAGRRAELIEVLGGEDSHAVAGCLSFVTAEDRDDSDVLWVTEVWASEASHKASLDLPPSKSGWPPIETLVAYHERMAVTKPVEKHSHPLHGETPVINPIFKS